jgi:hypothetical protein
VSRLAVAERRIQHPVETVCDNSVRVQATGSTGIRRPLRSKKRPPRTTAPPSTVARPGLSERISHARSAETTGSARTTPETTEAST